MGVTRSDYHRALEFVREFCGPVAPDLFVPQVIKGLFRLVPCDAAGCGTLDLTGGENSVVGSPPEEILNAVSGPLQSALTSVHMLADLTERTWILEDALEVAGLNVLIISAQGRIRFESPTARHLLVFYFGRDSYGDRLPDAVLRWMCSSSARLSEPSPTAGESNPLYMVRSGRRLSIRMLPHPAGYMLVLEEEYEGANLTRLTDLGLTRREAEVLSYIAMGKTGPEIAILLGISHDTVRKHTSTIFEKLEVETRTAAAAIALERLQSVPRP